MRTAKRLMSGLLILMLLWAYFGIGTCFNTAVFAAGLKPSALSLSGIVLTEIEHPNELFTRVYKDNAGVKITEEAEFAYTTYTMDATGPITVTGATDYADNIKQSHPRLYVNDFADLLERIDRDYMSAKFYNTAKTTADKLLSTQPLELTLTERNSILDVSRELQSRVYTLAITYKIEQQKHLQGRADAMDNYEIYKERLCQELAYVANYRFWGHNQFLCCAEISNSYAIAYDWLYDDVEAQTRALWREACYQKGILPFLYNYIVKPTGTNFPDTIINWNSVCNASAIMTGIAFYDADDTVFAPVCRYLIERGAECMWNGLVQYEDGGFYREGIGYWAYSTRYMGYGISAYEGAVEDGYVFPSRFTHASDAGLAQTADFPIYLNGVAGAFNFGDAGIGIQTAEVMYFLSNRYNKPEYAAYLNNILLLYDFEMTGMKSVFSLLWYQPLEASFDTLSKLPLDKAHVSDSDVNILSLRSAFDVNQSHTDNAFAAMQGGVNTANHMGLSLGSFVLDINGQRFVRQVGAGNYAWPGYFASTTVKSQRYTYYAMRAEGNNTIIANPGQDGEQNKNALVQIIESGSSAATGYGILDMTSTNDVFTKAHRGMLLTDNRSRLIVQDEIQTSSPSEIYWFAHTGMESKVSVVVSADGKRATLTSGDQSIYASITSGPADATFEYVDALPLPTSPNPTVQIGKDYGKKLRIHMSNVTNTTLTVEYASVDAVDANGTLPVLPLQEWSSLLSDVETPQIVDYLSQNRYSTDWYNSRLRTCYIHNDEELAGVAYLVNNGIVDFGGRTVKLADDISLSDTLQWTPIGTSEHPFRGVFDGSQRTVSGMYFDQKSAKLVGLFGKTQNAVLKNVCIDGAQISAASDIGALVGFAKASELYNVFVNHTQLRGNMRLGGIVGMQSGGGIKNCSLNGAVLGTCTMYGGICGYSESALVDNCNAYVKLSDKIGSDGYATSTGKFYGGIVGFSAYSSVMHSYYFHSRGTMLVWGTQAVNNQSFNLTPYNGKYNTSYTVTANGGNTLQYNSGRSSILLKTILNNWVKAQTDDEDYLSWELIGEDGVYGAKPIYVPETVDDATPDYFESNCYLIEDLGFSDGRLIANIQNLLDRPNAGYIVILQKRGDLAQEYTIRPVSIQAKATMHFELALASENITEIHVFAVDSFTNMRLKSAVLELAI